MQNCIQHWRRKDWFWHSRNPVTKLLEYKFYQDLSRNYDQESSQGNQTANSLLSLIADGAFRATNLGRDFWKALIGPDGSLQLNCNREGPNAVCSENVTPSKARIGIVANNQNFCYSCMWFQDRIPHGRIPRWFVNLRKRTKKLWWYWGQLSTFTHLHTS